jgi:HSP20 family protein
MTREVEEARGREMELREKQTVSQETTRPGWTFRPDVDIVERREEFLVTADLPGVGEDDVRVQLDNGLLTIDAQPSARADETWRPLYAEYRTGGYHREFAMGEAIDAGKISAKMRDGVLEIRLPKAERHQPRRIAITRG